MFSYVDVENRIPVGHPSRDHLSLDSTLSEVCASIKSFRPREPAASPPEDDKEAGDDDGDFHDAHLANATHWSTTDPEARLYRKGKGRSAKLCHMGHALVESRSGMVVRASVMEASGTAEREAGLELLRNLPERARRRTVGLRQGVRREGLRGGMQGLERHAARRGEAFRRGGGRAHHPA